MEQNNTTIPSEWMNEIQAIIDRLFPYEVPVKENEEENTQMAISRIAANMACKEFYTSLTSGPASAEEVLDQTQHPYVIGASSIRDSIIQAMHLYALRNRSEWISVEELPEHGVEVIGQSDEWIDVDYNPKGTRLCFHNDGNWISAYWNNTHDCYETDSITKPTKYKLI